MSSCWPYIRLKWDGSCWQATARNCNTFASGKTPKEAYDNWQYFYRLDI